MEDADSGIRDDVLEIGQRNSYFHCCIPFIPCCRDAENTQPTRQIPDTIIPAVPKGGSVMSIPSHDSGHCEGDCIQESPVDQEITLAVNSRCASTGDVAQDTGRFRGLPSSRLPSADAHQPQSGITNSACQALPMSTPNDPPAGDDVASEGLTETKVSKSKMKTKDVYLSV